MSGRSGLLDRPIWRKIKISHDDVIFREVFRPSSKITSRGPGGRGRVKNRKISPRIHGTRKRVENDKRKNAIMSYCNGRIRFRPKTFPKNYYPKKNCPTSFGPAIGICIPYAPRYCVRVTSVPPLLPPPQWCRRKFFFFCPGRP